MRDLPYYVKREIALSESGFRNLKLEPGRIKESEKGIVAWTEEHDDAERWIIVENEASAVYYRFERYESRIRTYDEHGEVFDPDWMDKLHETASNFILVVSYLPSLDAFTSNNELLRTALSYNRGMDKDCPKEEHDSYMNVIYLMCSYDLPILEESYRKAKDKQ